MAALALFPYVGQTFYLTLLTTVLIYGIFAMSLDLLMGYSGMPSFGHAAFFGLGGYTAALTALHLSPNLFFTLGCVLVVSAIAAIIIGFLATQAAGVYFIMLTLALSQLLYSLASRMDRIGGGNGLPGIPRPSLHPLPEVFNFSSRNSFFYLTLTVFLLCYLILRKIVNSPFGYTLIGIRENESRMHSIGYNPRLYKLSAFIISGAIGGVAGAFFVYQTHFVSPDLFYWALSGVVMVMVIIGGAGTLYGPVLGAAFYVFLQDIVSSHTARWQMLFGFSLIAFVLFAREGIAGLARSTRARLQWRST